MKNEQSTDRIIRQKLKNHASANPVHLWDAIEAELPMEKKDSRGLWWIAGGFLGVALLLATGYYMMADNQTNVNTITNTDETTTSTEEHKQSDSEKVALSVVADFDETPSNENLNENEKTVANEAVTLVAESDVDVAVSKTVTKSDEADVLTTKSSVVSTLKENNNNTSTTKKSTPPVEADVLPLKENTTTEATKPTAEAYIETTEVTEPIAIAETKSFSKNALLLNPLNLESKMSPSIMFDAEKEMDWDGFLQDPKCATFGKWLKLYFYVDAYLSPEVVFKSLEPKNTDASDFADNRLATESQLFSYSAGARFSVVSNFGLALRSGFVYSQINEEFTYQEESSKLTIVNEYDDFGNLINSDTIREEGTNFIRTANRYKSIDVPLILGYEVSMKNFGLSINTGVFFNLTSSQEGTFLSPDFEPIGFNESIGDNGPAFRNSVNLSLYGSLAMYYIIDDHWQIMLEPQVRYFMDPITRASYDLEQRYVTAGFITGLRYRF